MRTTHTACSYPAPRQNNLVDLAQFRRRQAMAPRDSGRSSGLWREAGFCPVVLTLSLPERRRARRERQAWRLDLCASLAVVVMTLAFTLRVFL